MPGFPWGSPPHTRGPLTSGKYVLRTLGITPAHAGPIICYCNIENISRDHPRTRGAHRSCKEVYAGLMGSPPHTRGPSSSYLWLLPLQGITPAHAGPMVWHGNTINLPWDHPRTRGAHGFYVPIVIDLLGSPPHTRGPWRKVAQENIRLGITPCYPPRKLKLYIQNQVKLREEAPSRR